MRCAVMAFLLLAALIAGGCTQLQSSVSHDLLRPLPPLPVTPRDEGMAFEELRFPSAGGVSLHGWFIPSPSETNRDGRAVVACHEGVFDITRLVPTARWLRDGGFHVLLFDPRGCGQSSGTPDLSMLGEDALAAIAALRARPDVAPDRVCLVGLGLGASAALRAAGSTPTAGLALVDVFSVAAQVGHDAGNTVGFPLASGIAAAFMTATAVPPELDLMPNASRASAPTLLVQLPGRTQGEAIRLWRILRRRGVATELWLVPENEAAPPHSAAWWAECRATVVAFLNGAVDGRPTPLSVVWRRVGAPWDPVRIELDLDLQASAPGVADLCFLRGEEVLSRAQTATPPGRSTQIIATPGRPTDVAARLRRTPIAAPEGGDDPDGGFSVPSKPRGRRETLRAPG